jgi:hypothetical protein
MALLAIGELVARAEVFQAHLTAPDLDSRHYQLGRKLALLEESVRESGPLDCLAIGSSTVDLGFDPMAFSNSFEDETGVPLHCFNFGIDASSMAATAAIAQILIEDYQPRLLIVGTDARDYAVSEYDEDAAVVLGTEWVRYRLGERSLKGWLVEHSYLFRYRRILGRMTRFDFRDWGGAPLNHEISPDGQTRVATIGENVHHAPSEDGDSYIVSYLTGLLGNYRMLPENLEALRKVTGLQGQGRAIVIVEMPLPEGYFTFFGDEKADYELFVQQVQQMSESGGLAFIPAMSTDDLPAGGWVDYLHLNASGARVFSRWLAERMAHLAMEGKIEGLQITSSMTGKLWFPLTRNTK